MPNRTRWRLRYPVNTEDDQNRLRHRLATFNADPHIEQVFCEIPPEDPFVREFRVIFRPGFTQPATPELHHLNLTQTGELQHTSEAQVIAEALRIGHGGMFQARPDVFDFHYTTPRPLPPPEPIPITALADWLRVGAWAQERDKNTRPFRIVSFGNLEGTPCVRVLYHGDPEHHQMVLLLTDVLARCEPVAAPAERLTAWNRLLKGLSDDDEK